MKIFIARNPTEAHIVCELLRSEHVACEVRGEGLFGLQGELPFGDDTDAYIWLLNTYHEKKAVTIVQEYQSSLIEMRTTPIGTALAVESKTKDSLLSVGAVALQLLVVSKK